MRFRKYKLRKNPTLCGRHMVFMVNKNLPHIKSYNDKNYEKNGCLLDKAIKWKIIVLLKVGILIQRTPKTEPERKSCHFLIIIMVIKYILKMEVKISKNNLKESSSMSRPTQGYKNHRKRSSYAGVTKFRKMNCHRTRTIVHHAWRAFLTSRSVRKRVTWRNVGKTRGSSMMEPHA